MNAARSAPPVESAPSFRVGSFCAPRLTSEQLRAAAIRLHDASAGRGCAMRPLHGEWSQFDERIWNLHFQDDERRITAALDLLVDAGLASPPADCETAVSVAGGWPASSPVPGDHSALLSIESRHDGGR